VRLLNRLECTQSFFHCSVPIVLVIACSRSRSALIRGISCPVAEVSFSTVAISSRRCSLPLRFRQSGFYDLNSH